MGGTQDERRRLGRAARRLATALVGLAAVAASSASSLAAVAPQEAILNFYSVLLGAMKNGPTHGIRGRCDQIAAAIEQDFDLSYMTQKTVGLAWETLSDEQKKQVWVAFARYMTATYADRFHSYSGEKFEVTGQQNAPYGSIVESRIVKSNGEPVSINYLMRQNGGEWQVGDIYLIGAISQLATLRSQFASVLEREGVALKHEVLPMGKLLGLGIATATLPIALSITLPLSEQSAAQPKNPAFVIVERTATTGPETIQQEYAKLAREILPRYGAHYLARSQQNTLLEGEGAAPCCIAILEFPNMDAVKRWYDSPENDEAAKVRQTGAKFRIVAVQGLPPEK